MGFSIGFRRHSDDSEPDDPTARRGLIRRWLDAWEQTSGADEWLRHRPPVVPFSSTGWLIIRYGDRDAAVTAMAHLLEIRVRRCGPYYWGQATWLILNALFFDERIFNEEDNAIAEEAVAEAVSARRLVLEGTTLCLPDHVWSLQLREWVEG